MKRCAFLLLGLFLLLPLTGCGGKKDMDFIAVLPQDVSTLDPQTATGQAAQTVIGSLFEGLCRIGEDGEVLPGAADRWDHNGDFTQFTFHLRSGIKWSNGEPVTADDFVFGVVRALRKETGTSSVDDLFLLKNARAIYNGEADESSLGFRAENERTLVAELERGYPDFPALTAGNHYMPCSQSYFEESEGHYGLSAGYLLTNGPFTFPHEYAWNTDYNERSLTLVRAEDYRGERRVAPASLTYLIDYDEAIDKDPVGSLLAGSVDILSLPEDTARKAEEQGCRVLALDDAVTGLLLNPQSDALGYVGTRELFLKTINRKSTLEACAEGREEALGIIPRCVLWDGESYYGVGETRYPLEDNAVTQGIPSLLQMLDLEKVPSITVLCPDDEESVRIADSFLQSWNAQLGNAFNIQPLPESELQSRVAGGEYEAALYTLRAGGTSPYHVLKSFESGASPSLLRNETYDAALHSLSFDLESYRELELALQEEYVFYPLFADKSYYAVSPGVTGVTASPDQRIDFIQARKP